MEKQRQEQQRRAAERYAARSSERDETKAKLAVGGVLAANKRERLQLREQRLERYYGRLAPHAVYVGDVVGVGARGGGDEAWSTEAAADDAPQRNTEPTLERIVGTADFLGVRYLEAGATAQRAVGQVVIRGPGGRELGFGTGFLVSPRLLLTNNHVLESAEIAAASHVRFNHQDGVDGRPLAAVDFDFRPDAFFITSEALDFTLVAVNAREEQLRPFGFYPLIAAQGKALLGECLSIIQHPGARPKQVALRNNKIVDLLDDFIHYETDTEPGSSGSPGTNDQWEVVVLHHASVRRGNGFANEGVRVSRIVDTVRAARLDTDEQRRLRDQLLRPDARPTPPRETLVTGTGEGNGNGTGGGNGTGTGGHDGGGGAVAAPRQDEPPAAVRAEGGGVTFTVPLEVTVRLGTPGGGTAFVAAPPPPGGRVEEAISIDPDYSTRRGYDPGFLGGGQSVPLPELTPEMLRRTARNRQARGAAEHVLPYHHFSVVVNADRQLAWFTAVNIDGKRSVKVKREGDRWIADPRIGRDEQTDEAVYASNPLDRGHLVRRLDPAWGDERTAKAGNDDTFHFANCAPQHERFNQNQTTWAGLEDYVLQNADNHDLRVSVFTGPVLDDERDLPYRGVKLPLQFWKVVVMARRSGGLSATAYLLSQASLLDDVRREAVRPEEFQFGAYRTFQVPVERIERLTGLRFGALSRFDPLAGLESAGDVRRAIDRLEQIRL